MTYAGGKGRDGVFQVIINNIPPHVCYIEPFLGGASVMAAKLPAAINIGVDKSADVIARAERQFKSDRSPQNGASDRGISHRRKSPRLLLADHVAELFDIGDEVNQVPALRGAVAPSFRFYRRKAETFLGNHRMMPRTFIYCDPPYLIQTRSNKGRLYEHEYSDFEHIDLLKLLRRLPGKPMIAISGYRSDLYMELLNDWRVVTFKNVTRSGQVVTEYLWCNYPEPRELHDYRYLGRDFRDRERIRRIQRNVCAKLKRMTELERQALMVEALWQMTQMS